MSQTHPGLVNPKHVSETMSNQSPFFPSSGFPGRGQAASFLGRMPRSGATSLTVGVYSHSWIIVDARVK